ncbi:hypothetical protein Q4E93_33320 [Flavitalea sp. BT771]|uniref:hypothetical protein n=1 Tax=Flavitalea sp. BT771 TaxID=3063329 RepID=UPI0026E145AD|nr:hypothetical protein [Flavitalea sp. BT771]MDO6435543.1 hypothetical protein [Flavitalea sp. BT771]MDV6224443.1 hypothetical protein [Flavitalea sp. BT771]
MRQILNRLHKTADLNIAIVTKVISDWAVFLKKISPLASILFILLNVRTLLKKRSTVITLLILVPLLVITRRAEVLRVIFSIALFWIFLEKFTAGIGTTDRRLAVFLSLYALVLFAGIFYPWFYLMMYDGSLRYKFILESHNALCILVFAIFIYLCETLLSTIRLPSSRGLKILLMVAICALTLVFLFIKSRLYIGMSGAYLFIIAFKRWRKMPALLLLPSMYIGLFLLLTLLSQQAAFRMDPRVIEQLRREMLARDSTLASDSSYLAGNADFAAAMMANRRLFSASGTGRDKLVKAVMVTISHGGWQHFIYNNNVDHYLTVKRRVPNINIAASSLTENAYLTTILSAGFTGLILLLYMAGLYLAHFIRRKEIFSLAFFLLLLAAWFFEETTIFTFSLMAQLFALGSINRIEKEDHEGSAGN